MKNFYRSFPFIAIVALCYIVFSSACSDDDNPGVNNKDNISITFLSHDCNSVRFRIVDPAYSASAEYKLFRNSTFIATIRMNESPAFYRDFGLAPSTTYSYQVMKYENGSQVDQSPTSTFSTQDPIVFAPFEVGNALTIGEPGTRLFDVSLLNYSGVAAGIILYRLQPGGELLECNTAWFSNSQMQYMKVPFHTNGAPLPGNKSDTVTTVCVIGESAWCFSSNGYITEQTATAANMFETRLCVGRNPRSAWGNSPKAIYVAGDDGAFLWDGINKQVTQLMANIRCTDVYGIGDTAYFVGKDNTGGGLIFKFVNKQGSAVPLNGATNLTSTWIDGSNQLYVTGTSSINFIHNGNLVPYSIPQGFQPARIRGGFCMICPGSGGEVLCYDGVSWLSMMYGEKSASYQWCGVAIDRTQFVLAGNDAASGKGVILNGALSYLVVD